MDGPPVGTPAARGFTLIEMLTTVAVLTIVLGMMVSLARHVRDRSAQQLTRDLLATLDRLMTQYVQRNGSRLPAVAPFISPEGTPDEASLQRTARSNNEQFVLALRQQEALSKQFSNLSVAYYDEVSLRDAWGNPIVLLPHQHPAIGMAPGDRFFFLSAGPDRRYLTRDDNLYSYETAK